MNPYVTLGSAIGIDTIDASTLSARLTAWHDAMVAHERRLLSDGPGEACHDECPHVEARSLWAEAVATFGAQAHSLTFLRTRALGGGIRSLRPDDDVRLESGGA